MRCDLINNFIELIKNKTKKIIRFKKDIDYTYNLENKLIINNTSEQLCNFKQGLKLIKLIDKIKILENINAHLDKITKDHEKYLK